MSEDLWGRVTIEKWKDVPFVANRIANENDVKLGRAVFYLENPGEIGELSPYTLELPHFAILTEEESGEELPVIIIQAEQAEDRIYVGYRPLGGGNGMCLLSDVELLDAPDDRFRI